jgi:hypothetical protein
VLKELQALSEKAAAERTAANNAAAIRIRVEDLIPSGASIQMVFAALQMSLAQSNKDKAKAYIDDITSQQAQSKECAAMIAKARSFQDKKSAADTELKTYFTTHTGNIPDLKTGTDKDTWEYNIKSLQSYQETLGSNIQQQMVFVQDFMGQYNSYLTGCNSAIQQANQTLGTITRGQ